MDQRPDRLAHVNRLVHDHVEADPLRQAGQDRAGGLLHPFDDPDRVRSRLPVDRDVDLPLPVDPDDIRLDLVGVLRHGDVFQEDRRAVLHLHRDVVELRHLRDHPVRIDEVVHLAELRVAGRDEDVVALQRLHHVHRRKVAGVELVTVHVGQDPPELSPVNRRRDDPRDPLEAVAEVEVGDVVQLRLVIDGRGDRQQAHRDRPCRVERHHHRRDRPRRKVEQVRHRVGGDLGHRRVGVDVIAEEVLDDAHPEHRLAFLTRDAVALPGPALEAGHDVPLHHDGGHPRVERDDLHGRSREDRKQVHGDPEQARDADHQDRQDADHDGIGVVEGALDHRVVRKPTRSDCGRSGIIGLLTRWRDARGPPRADRTPERRERPAASRPGR